MFDRSETILRPLFAPAVLALAGSVVACGARSGLPGEDEDDRSAQVDLGNEADDAGFDVPTDDRIQDDSGDPTAAECVRICESLRHCPRSGWEDYSSDDCQLECANFIHFSRVANCTLDWSEKCAGGGTAATCEHLDPSAPCSFDHEIALTCAVD